MNGEKLLFVNDAFGSPDCDVTSRFFFDVTVSGDLTLAPSFKAKGK